MFLFLSFVVALVSLYYLGVMVDSYNTDTTYLTPLVALLIYSVLTIVRELKKEPISWLSYEDDFSSHPYGDIRSSDYSYGEKTDNHNQWLDTYGSRNSKINEKTEYFAPTKKEKKDDEKMLVHYPSSQDVREKMKELEKSRWFRFRRMLGNIFAYDITTKYYEEFKKPYKVNRKGKVVTVNQTVNKEDHSRFQPNNNWWAEKERAEYNAVTKLMGRSCEIALTDEEAAVLYGDETNNSIDNGQK